MNHYAQQRIAVAGSTAQIESLASLRDHLQWAIELEHSTLPPYLCALYSIDASPNPEAVQVVTGVFVEEMIHMALAANLLNSVGGQPRLDAPQLLPSHPRCLPHQDHSLELSLLPFGPEALEMFLRLEQPAPSGASPEADCYHTIGQFYDAIDEALRHLCGELGERAVFSGDPTRQITTGPFSHSGGRLTAIDSLDSALAALHEIVEQGEGTAQGQIWDGDQSVVDPDRGEVAHYYRLLQLKLGRRYRCADTPRSGPTGEVLSVDFTGVHPMRRNPQLVDHPPGHPIRIAQEEFNSTYCDVLHRLEQAFNGTPAMLGAATGAMYSLRAQAQNLMKMPDGEGRTAGPTFNYVPAELRRSPDRR